MSEMRRSFHNKVLPTEMQIRWPHHLASKRSIEVMRLLRHKILERLKLVPSYNLRNYYFINLICSRSENIQFFFVLKPILNLRNNVHVSFCILPLQKEIGQFFRWNQIGMQLSLAKNLKHLGNLFEISFLFCIKCNIWFICSEICQFLSFNLKALDKCWI